jgi:hypothetical protein
MSPHRRWLAVLVALAGPLAAQEPPPVARPAVPPPLPPPWRFSVELGITDISGNRDLRLYSGAFVAEHQRRDLFILNGKLEARYGESNHERSVDNSAARLRFDWRPNQRTSPFVAFDVERDAIRRIQMKVSGGFGANFNIVARDDRRTLVSLGTVLEIENRAAGVTPNRVEDVRALARFSYFKALSPGVRLDAGARVTPALRDAADYLAGFDAAVNAVLYRRLALRTRYEWKRDSRPAPGVRSRDDRLLTVAFVFSW